ncbi:MAG TPA: DNA ligase D [Candidatus Polarisedimenticolaceae bacterium]|nr:DNA ligase D [Candidatus Polarisedimenticolaceae bacterium]
MARKKVASLAEYRRKRDFSATGEPRGGKSGASRLYIVQKHAASRLHYDFRLELGGTLKSWAVPKGPSVAPGTKRLAVHVEDHPIEYGAFEGVIPKGQYGGGTVMLWDRGRWEPLGDAAEGYRSGKLKFRLHGKRLKGLWTLVRMGGRASEGGKNWLLIKDRDQAAGGIEPVERESESVTTGRSMDEIRQQKKRVWEGKDKSVDPAALPGARRGHATTSFTPQLATLSKEVPRGDDWLHEIKLDGYRMLAFVAGGRVRLMSRNGKDWSARFPTVMRAVAKLPLREGVLDGEVVALRPDGTSDFQVLQNLLKSKHTTKIVYYVFDLPFYAGHDLRSVPLIERKHLLAGILASAGRGGAVRFSDHVRGGGEQVLRQACKLALEGVISKRADAAYQSKRAPSWLKIKCSGRQEFVIVGWTDPQGSRKGFGSLVLAHHDAAGRLVYSGKVGTGFDDALLADLSRKLARIATPKHPLGVDPPRAEVRGVHWARPRIVAEIEFTEWTADGRLRHPSFLGIREDKEPDEVVREETGREARPAVASRVRLTHPERVLWPEEKLTKADLAAYYETVADLALPHIAGRPLAIVRCPRGRAQPCFFQKHPSGKSSAHLMISDLDGLLSLVQLGALEIHPWGTTAERLDRPDRLVFDLDPGAGIPWKRLIEAALAVRERLEQAGLRSFARTSGGKGLHVVAPLSRRNSWDDLKTFARGIAEEMVAREPDRYVATATKSRRDNRIFIDWLRNARGATAVASYSTRARPHAPIAAPVTWEELPKIASSDAFRVRGIERRLSEAGDPWPGFLSLRQSIPASALRKRRR